MCWYLEVGLWEVIKFRYEGGALWWEKRKRDQSFLSLQFLRTQWESSWEASKRALPRNKLVGTLILDFSASRTVREWLLLKLLCQFFFFYRNLSWIWHWRHGQTGRRKSGWECRVSSVAGKSGDKEQVLNRTKGTRPSRLSAQVY